MCGFYYNFNYSFWGKIGGISFVPTFAFGPKRGELKEDWRKLRYDKL